MNRLRTRLTYANVMATVAVFIALGGASYATIVLPKNSVGTKQIKNGQVRTADLADNAVTSPKVKDGSLLSADFAPGQLPAGAPGAAGPQGLQGPKGDKGDPGTNGTNGAPGSALAFAHVNADGTLDAARSKNVELLATVGGFQQCFRVTPTPLNVVATIQAGSHTKDVAVTLDVGGYGCPAGTNAIGFTFNRSDYGGVQGAYFVNFN